MTQTPVQPGIMDIALYVSGESTLAGRDDVTREATTQLWPHRDGTDAMFVALLRRS